MDVEASRRGLLHFVRTQAEKAALMNPYALDLHDEAERVIDGIGPQLPTRHGVEVYDPTIGELVGKLVIAHARGDTVRTSPVVGVLRRETGEYVLYEIVVDETSIRPVTREDLEQVRKDIGGSPA